MGHCIKHFFPLHKPPVLKAEETIAYLSAAPTENCRPQLSSVSCGFRGFEWQREKDGRSRSTQGLHCRIIITIIDTCDRHVIRYNRRARSTGRHRIMQCVYVKVSGYHQILLVKSIKWRLRVAKKFKSVAILIQSLSSVDRSSGMLFPRIFPPPAKSNGMRKLQLLHELLVNARWARSVVTAARCKAVWIWSRFCVSSSFPPVSPDKWVFGGFLPQHGRLLVNAIDLIAPSANGKRCLFCASPVSSLVGVRMSCGRGKKGPQWVARSR